MKIPGDARSTRLFLVATLMQAALLLCAAPHAVAQNRQRALRFDVPYACPGPARIKVLGCKGAGDSEMCDVQYLNDAAPNGLGALIQTYRATITQQLSTCTVAGEAAATQAQETAGNPVGREPQRPAVPVQQARTTAGCASDAGLSERPAAGNPPNLRFTPCTHTTDGA